MAPVRGNAQLAAVIAETGWSHAQVARAFARVAAECGAREFAAVGRSHVSHWACGSRPSGRAPNILCEALSRRLGRVVTPAEIGLDGASVHADAAPDWHADTLIALTDLGRADTDMNRRRALAATAYSVGALALPGGRWWTEMARRGSERATLGVAAVGRGDVEAVREMALAFSRIDQRHGGGHARSAVVQYLTTDVSGYLTGRYADERVRKGMFSTASELAYLAGWMAFDNSEHPIAQHYFTLAMKLAAEADDPAMAGHVLRAMAHQAVDLGHHRQGLDLAEASMDGQRYRSACARERALLAVVRARALAATGARPAATSALSTADNDLAGAEPGQDEPSRVYFFGEASLAHETACTLRDIGDLPGAITQFRRSVRTRQSKTFARTHIVTLGYLGGVLARSGRLEEACATWSSALDVMDGVHSGRARQAVVDMRSALSPFRGQSIHAVVELDARGAAYLAGRG